MLFCLTKVNLQTIAHRSQKNRRYLDCHKVAAWGIYSIRGQSPEFSGQYPDRHSKAIVVRLISK